MHLLEHYKVFLRYMIHTLWHVVDNFYDEIFVKIVWELSFVLMLLLFFQ